MSPLVQRSRAGHWPASNVRPGWGMLVFESCSAGVLAVLVSIAAVMLIVSLYVILVWPLTFWDLSNTGLENYGSWANAVLWSIFAGGTLAGFWCLSGAAFKSTATDRTGDINPDGDRLKVRARAGSK